MLVAHRGSCGSSVPSYPFCTAARARLTRDVKSTIMPQPFGRSRVMRRAADLPRTPLTASSCTSGFGLLEDHSYSHSIVDVTIERSGDHIAAARGLQDQREQGSDRMRPSRRDHDDGNCSV